MTCIYTPTVCMIADLTFQIKATGLTNEIVLPINQIQRGNHTLLYSSFNF